MRCQKKNSSFFICMSSCNFKPPRRNYFSHCCSTRFDWDMKSPVDVTYFADSVILLRYFEAIGQVRRAISILKKRTGAHENTIREFSISNKGLSVGPPIDKFQGVLRGVPQFLNDTHRGADDAL